MVLSALCSENMGKPHLGPAFELSAPSPGNDLRLVAVACLCSEVYAAISSWEEVTIFLGIGCDFCLGIGCCSNHF